MKKTKNRKGSISIIAIIAVLIALGGIGAVVYFVTSNESPLSPIVEEVREERALEAQADGYPSLWAEAGLPEYPNGTLTKQRQGNDLVDGVQVTLETSDSISTVKTFWDAEMASLEFSDSPGPGTSEYATLILYSNGTKFLSLQITRIGEGPNNTVLLQYHE